MAETSNTGFQSTVNYTYAPGIVGSEATVNPTRDVVSVSVLGSTPGLRASSAGVTVGNFAWIENDGATVTCAPGTSTTLAPAGFVYRNHQSLITGFLNSATSTINEGFPVQLKSGGDFWATSLAACVPGDYVFASTTDGSITTASTTTEPTGYILATGWRVTSAGEAGGLCIISGDMSPAPVTLLAATTTTTT